MSRYGLHGGRARRDKNEPEIVHALKAAGCVVAAIDAPYIGDLLVWAPRPKGQKLCDLWLLEVKAPGAQLRPGQAEWAATTGPAGIRYAVVMTVDEALRAVRGK